MQVKGSTAPTQVSNETMKGGRVGYCLSFISAPPELEETDSRACVRISSSQRNETQQGCVLEKTSGKARVMAGHGRRSCLRLTGDSKRGLSYLWYEQEGDLPAKRRPVLVPRVSTRDKVATVRGRANTERSNKEGATGHERLCLNASCTCRRMQRQKKAA